MILGLGEGQTPQVTFHCFGWRGGFHFTDTPNFVLQIPVLTSYGIDSGVFLHRARGGGNCVSHAV